MAFTIINRFSSQPRTPPRFANAINTYPRVNEEKQKSFNLLTEPLTKAHGSKVNLGRIDDDITFRIFIRHLNVIINPFFKFKVSSECKSHSLIFLPLIHKDFLYPGKNFIPHLPACSINKRNFTSCNLFSTENGNLAVTFLTTISVKI